ncbi:hypothetical protein ACPV54_18245 [Vibrio mediterranei]
MRLFYRLIHNLLDIKNVRVGISYLRKKSSYLDRLIVLLHRRYMLQKMHRLDSSVFPMESSYSDQDGLVRRMLEEKFSDYSELSTSTIACYLDLKRKAFDELDSYGEIDLIVGAYLDLFRRFPSKEEQNFMYVQFFNQHTEKKKSIEKVYSYLMVSNEFSTIGTIRDIEL